MNIIDTNTLNHIFKNNIRLEGVYYLAPDIKEESEIVEQIFGKKIPDGIRDISGEPSFNECVYVKNYKEMLNKHRGRSFYNMTGFGDISILALLQTLREHLKTQPKLFEEMQDGLVVITEDLSLKKKIEKEFNSDVEILGNSSIY